MGSESIEAVRVSKSSSSGRFPPGFRFHPTDEELILYYLKRKICRQSLKLDFIGEVDVYKWDPEELPGQSKLKTGDRQWFFFSPRDRKYPNGGRSSRATMHGYWKATGKDRIIKCNSRTVGIKKTLVYYQGRAPSGQRTDWVMHEYTLDEEELKRCQYAKEYYALYKVFKKSGPGPKNGEQYGAPFVEEEWADADYFDVDALLLQNIGPTKQLHVDNAKDVSKEEEPILTNGIEEILNKIVDEPETAPPLVRSDPIISEEESDFFEQLMVLSPYYVQPGSDLARSTHEASEVTSVTNVPIEEVQPLVVNEDFLEMDDLIGPQPAIQSSERSVGEDLQISDFENLYEFDMYHDLTRFSDMGSFGNQQIQQHLEYGIENSGFNSHTNDTGSEIVNDDHQISYDLWTHDQRNCDIMASQSTQTAISPPSSGVVIDENTGNSDSRVNPQTETDNGTDSWFTSALWAFVESIPTTPASASESSALVNKAFERMSSFSRIRNVNEAAAAAAVAVAGVKRLERSSRSSSSRGIIYFSILGVLFAILWVFVGTSIELLARCIS